MEKAGKMKTELEKQKEYEQKNIHYEIRKERELNIERLKAFREGFDNFKIKKIKVLNLMRNRNRKKRLIKLGLCIWCGKNKTINTQHCELCQVKHRVSGKKSYQKKKSL